MYYCIVMIQKTFGIYADEQTGEPELNIEAGTFHLACWTVLDNNIHSFEYFQTEKTLLKEFKENWHQLKLYSKLLTAKYQHVNLIWNHEECLLSNKNFKETEDNAFMLETIFGDRRAYHIHSNEKNSLNIFYRGEAEAEKIISQNFSSLTTEHVFSRLISNENNSGSIMNVYCYPHQAIIILQHNNALQLVNNHCYETSEDVLYYLLNTCRQFNIDVQQVQLNIHGLLDDDSELHTVLHKYFPLINFGSHNASFTESEKFAEFPAHYFSPFFNVGA
ncbi:MAG: hypothetical protein JWN76_3039 [Chitinophagaceae bacterium]|nr:hypothetical protein [Chitinophagaceae bacterium]